MSTQNFFITLLTGLALLGLSGCGDIKSPTFQPRLLELKVCEQSGNSCPSTGSACNSAGSANPSLVAVNQNLQLCALGRYEVLQGSDDDFDVSSSWRNVTNQAQWSSADSARVSVANTGNATGVAESLSAVKLTAAVGDMSSDTFVRVTPPALNEVDIVPNGTQETLVGARMQFQCEGTYSANCNGTASRTCDVTNIADFTSSDPSTFSVNNDGRGDALAATIAGSPVDISCAAEDATKSPPEQRVSVPPASINICSQASIQGLEFIPSTLTIAAGQQQQLRLFANYISCTTGNLEQLEVTNAPSTTMTSDDISIADVDSAGVLDAINGGQAQITGTFAGETAVLDVSVKFSEVRQIDVIGPDVALAGVQTALNYYAVAILQDVDSGADLGQEILLNAPDQPFAMWSSDAAAISFANVNSGEATMLPAALPQTVNISASYKGITGSKATQIVNVAAAVEKLEITPDVACVGDELSLPLGVLGAPILQLDAHAILNYTADLDGDGTDEALSCSVNATQVADWSTSAAELTAQTLFNLLGLGDLLTPILEPLLGSCADGSLLPVTVGEDPFGPPVEVGNGVDNNGDGEITGAEVKGNVAGNGSTMNLAGGACIFANFDQTFGVDLGANRGVASALAATELQTLCEPLLATTQPSVASCAPAAPTAP